MTDHWVVEDHRTAFLYFGVCYEMYTSCSDGEQSPANALSLNKNICLVSSLIPVAAESENQQEDRV